MTDYYLYASGSAPGTKLSNCNRSVEESTEKIVREHQLADGSLKRDVVAVKRTWTLSWKYLPTLDADVWDGGMGADSLKALFNTTGILVFREPDDEGSYSLYDTLVTPSGFRRTMSIRNGATGKRFWDVTLTLREA